MRRNRARRRWRLEAARDRTHRPCVYLQPAGDLAGWCCGGDRRARPGGFALWWRGAVLLRGHREPRLTLPVPRRPARSAVGDQRAQLMVGLLGPPPARRVMGLLR